MISAMKPVISEYINIYQYLQDYYAWRKQLEPDFSYSSWSNEMGIKNKSYLRFMTLGKRPINASTIESFKVILSLSKTEQRNFEILCLYSQAKTKEQRRLLGKELIQFLRADALQTETEAHHELMMNPLSMMIRTLLTFKDLKKTAGELATLLEVKEAEVHEALDQLLTLKMVEKVDETYRSTDEHMRIADRFHGMGLDQFYRKSFKRASEALDLSKDSRRYRSWFVALKPDEMPTLVAEAEGEMRNRFLAMDSEEFAGKKLFQVVLATFPVSGEQT